MSRSPLSSHAAPPALRAPRAPAARSRPRTRVPATARSRPRTRVPGTAGGTRNVSLVRSPGERRRAPRLAAYAGRALSIGAVLIVSAFAHAQPVPSKAPSSTHLFPPGVQRGTRVQLRVGAECTPPGTEFTVNGLGWEHRQLLEQRLPSRGEPSPRRPPTEVPITDPKEWAAEVNVPADSPLGIAAWQLASSLGGTPSRPLIVGDLPEIIEQESNSTPETAEQVAWPVTINGQISGERDQDYYRFTGRRGQLLVWELMAARLDSRLDPVIQLWDPRGQRLAPAQVYVGGDPVAALELPENGEYLIRVANVSRHGGPAHVYRLTLSPHPYVVGAFPTQLVAGKPQTLELTVLGAQGLSQVTRQVDVPAFADCLRELSALPVVPPDASAAETPESSAAASDRAEGHGAPLSRRRSHVVQFEGLGNAFRLPVIPAGLPLLTDQSVSNPAAGTAGQPSGDPLAIRLPGDCDVAGRFETPRDQDRYVVSATAGMHLSLECRAAAAGLSAALPELVLLDPRGKQVARQLCVEQPGQRIYWSGTLAEDGEYQIHLRDLRYGTAGGPRYSYTLRVRQTGGARWLAETDRLNVGQGTEAALDTVLVREGGFKEPLEVRLAGAPPGLELLTTQIPAGAGKVKLKFRAAEEVPAGSYPVELVASASQIGNQRLVMPIAGGQRRTTTLHVCVCHKPLFRLFCSEAYLYAHRGSVFPYLMEVERLEGFQGPITLEISDRQNRDLDGIQMFQVTIPPGENQAYLPIYLPESMHINVQSQSQLYCQGFTRFVDAQGKRQAMMVVSEKRNMLRTMPPVVKLESDQAELSAEPGETVEVPLALLRSSNFPDPLTLELLRVEAVGDRPRSDSPAAAAWIDCPADQQFAAGANRLKVRLKVADTAPRGQTLQLTFRGTGKMRGETQIISETQVTLKIAARVP